MPCRRVLKNNGREPILSGVAGARDYRRSLMGSLARSTVRRALLAALLVGILLGLAACGSGSGSDADRVSTVAADDPAVAAARDESQSAWPQFVSSFERKPKLTYSVKVSLSATDGTRELIWVHVTAIDGDTLRGTLDNDPVSDLGLKFGDEVSVQRRQVEDWAVWDKGKVVLGGFSLAADTATTTSG